MKLSQWAKIQGICYLTAYRWFQSGKLPVEAYQAKSGTIIVSDELPTTKVEKVVVYCRVSNQSRKEELKYQVQRCEDFCAANGWTIHKTYKEVASGMNDDRKEFWKMINDNPTKIIIENKDRLTRFGFNYLKNLLSKQECEIVVINTSDTDEQDLMKDFVAVMTSFCYRLYGLRRAQNKLKGLKKIINDKNK